MKNTIIIAVRKELPENLAITVKNLLKQKDSEDEILVVADGEQALPELPCRIVIPYETPRGCGQARHQGIILSESNDDDIVTLVDGHMDFPYNFSKMIKEKVKEQEGIYYFKMQSVDHQWNDKGTLYYGADLRSRCIEPGNQAWALACKWSKEKTIGERTGIMGACYGFSYGFYRKMGEPLKLMEAWGCDEEILSLACHFSGGRIEVLDGIVKHMYAAPHTRDNLKVPEIIKIWGNRLSLLFAMPWSEPVRDDYIKWLKRSFVDWASVEVEVESRMETIEEIKEILRSKGHKFYKKVKEKISPMTEIEIKENLEKKKTLIVDDAKRNNSIEKKNNSIEPQVVNKVVDKNNLKTVEKKPILIQKPQIKKNTDCAMCNGRGTMFSNDLLKIYGYGWKQCKKCGHKCRME